MSIAFTQVWRALIPVLALVGCSSYSPPPMRAGLTLAEVTQKMGLATGRYALPDGRTRVEYARGPMGVHTYMIDVDSSGQVQQVDQVLTENRFNAIMTGMSRDQLLLELGRPAERRRDFRGHELWGYRFESTICRWFVVTLEPGGPVRATGYDVDPSCDESRARRRR